MHLDLLSTIPSLEHPGLSVREETVAFNTENPAHSRARLVDRNRFKLDVSHMGFSGRDRLELLRLTEASEQTLGNSRITDWLSPKFFESNFWYMWQTTFAFQAWHSAVELKRYLHRFMNEFPRIETLAGVKRTVYNQYDAIVRPLADWLKGRGVQFVRGTAVTDMAIESEDGRLRVRQLVLDRDGRTANVQLEDGDLVFFQNGSMTDASSLGSMTEPAPRLTKSDSRGWACGRKSRRAVQNSASRPRSTRRSRNPIGSHSLSPAAIRASSTRWRRSPATRPAPAVSSRSGTPIG